MDKRYQVFVSSTYEDLREERAEVMQALLELDCMPAGMELFPAASEEQWSWITKVIDESDYYLLIIGGRYGSLHPSKGLSFTELEYRYAVDIGKPIISFLHGSPSEISTGKTDPTAELRKQLSDFREFCQQRLCKYWSNPADLGGKVSRSMTQLMKRHPAVGWVRADYLPDDQKIQLLELQRELAEARDQLARGGSLMPVESLSSGDDEFDLSFFFETKSAKVNSSGNKYWVNSDGFWHTFKTTWNEVISTISDALLDGDTELSVTRTLNDEYAALLPAGTNGIGKDKIVAATKVSSEDMRVLRAQFIALGIVEHSLERSKKQWKLTPSGRQHVLNILTVKKHPKQVEVDSPSAD